MQESTPAPKTTVTPAPTGHTEAYAVSQVDNRSSTGQAVAFQQALASSPRLVAQRQAVAALDSSPRQVAQRQAVPNRTGLPDQLKAGVENLSGHSLDDVRVHYNSAKPAQLQAHAYAQGAEIHVAPGQEKHLPHEAWHVAQQKQGRVRATTQLKGVGVNEDSGLEKEADVMGARAARGNNTVRESSVLNETSSSRPIQLMKSHLDAGIYGSSQVSAYAAEFRKNNKIPPALNIGTFFFVKDARLQQSTKSSLGIAFRDDASGKKTNHGHSENQLFMQMRDFGWPDKVVVQEVYTERKECSDKTVGYFNARVLRGCGSVLKSIDEYQRSKGEAELNVIHSFEGGEQEIRKQIRLAMRGYRKDVNRNQYLEQLQIDMESELAEVNKECNKELNKLLKIKTTELNNKIRASKSAKVTKDYLLNTDNDSYSDNDANDEIDMIDDDDENAYVNYDDMGMDYSDSEESNSDLYKLNEYYDKILEEMVVAYAETVDNYMVDMKSHEPQAPAPNLDGSSNNNASSSSDSDKRSIFNLSDDKIFDAYVETYKDLFNEKIELLNELE